MIVEVMGVGGLIVDYILSVSDAFLSTITVQKGDVQDIEEEQLRALIQRSGTKPAIVPGGSAANVIKGLARFGRKVSLLGRLGKDSIGAFYAEEMAKRNVFIETIFSEQPTAQLLYLVTADGQRTFRVFRGASSELSTRDLDHKHFSGVRIVHIEGYALFNGDLAERAMHLAKENNALVSFDLANFAVVQRFRPLIFHLLENYVDIVFCNEEEARVFSHTNEKEACKQLGYLCQVAVVCLGGRGCFVKKGKEFIYFPAYLIPSPLDTTGAGDLFASGFLHGLLSGKSIEECAHYGSLAGAAVIQELGAEISDSRWRDIFSNLNRLKDTPEQAFSS